jgi:hypothetical protein
MRWDWNPPSPIETWVLDKIFDPEQGWTISSDDAPVKRITAEEDGNPNYVVSIGRINVWTWEVHHWNPGAVRNVSAGRLVARVAFTGITITDPTILLSSTYKATGLPSYGINEGDGQPALHAAFPIAPGFPVDLARRQLMVCIGTLAADAEECLQNWNKQSVDSRNKQSVNSRIDWDAANKVASVAGRFLRAFVGF